MKHYNQPDNTSNNKKRVNSKIIKLDGEKDRVKNREKDTDKETGRTATPTPTPTPNPKYDISIFLFTRDLRIEDNTGFIKAIQSSKTILPIFIFTPEQIDANKNPYKSNKSIQFMIESLDSLNHSIEKEKGELFCFHGTHEEVFKTLLKYIPFQAIYMNQDYTPYAKKREKNIASFCSNNDIAFHISHDHPLFIPGSILTQEKNYYQKFTPFYNVAIEIAKKQPHILEIKKTPTQKIQWFKGFDGGDKGEKGEKVDTLKKGVKSIRVLLKDAYIKYIDPSHKSLLVGGRKEGQQILRFMGTFKDYEDTRNQLSKETTHLSAYLKYGCISIRETYQRMKSVLGLEDGLIRQLIWRDFYLHIVDGFPYVLQGKSLKPSYDKIQWRNNASYIRAWKDGKTGFPIVDACMRELNTTGYMHNRGRLIVASFLIKLLLVDWRIGEKYFAQNLIDYDPASNNGNWQWVAGSGADSQPYFRIFNPWTQGMKHDPECKYIKKWLPELEDVESKHIHAWDKYSNDEKYRVIDYEASIIDYPTMRKEAIELYKKYL